MSDSAPECGIIPYDLEPPGGFPRVNIGTGASEALIEAAGRAVAKVSDDIRAAWPQVSEAVREARPEYCNICENFPCLGNH